MPEHTPAPWVVNIPEQRITGNVASTIECVTGRIPLQEVTEEEFANARLIEAAPDLLASLMEMVLNQIIEDDSHEDLLLFWCNECDSNAEDCHTRIIHTDDCVVGKAHQVIMRAVSKRSN